MASRSIVTRENLSRDFVIDRDNPTGPLRLNLGPMFHRHPSTGVITVEAGGEGGWPGVSPDGGNVLEQRGNGLYVPTPSGGGGDWPGVSEDAGNQAELRADGIYVPAGAGEVDLDQGNGITIAESGGAHVISVRRSSENGNQVAVSSAGVYVGGVPYSAKVADYTLLPAEANSVVMLSTDNAHLPASSATFAPLCEYTLVRNSEGFTLHVPETVSCNGQLGGTYWVYPTPGGVVVKLTGTNEWLLLGDAEPVEDLPEPASGPFALGQSNAFDELSGRGALLLSGDQKE